MEENLDEILIRSIASRNPRDVRVTFYGFTGQISAKGSLFPRIRLSAGV
jgi:hypothetical protein